MEEDLRIDDRRIDRIYLKEVLKLLPKDITDLFKVGNSNVHRFVDGEYIIGYLPSGKFVDAKYEIPKSSIFDIELIKVGVPDEEDIREYWCRRK